MRFLSFFLNLTVAMALAVSSGCGGEIEEDVGSSAEYSTMKNKCKKECKRSCENEDDRNDCKKACQNKCEKRSTDTDGDTDGDRGGDRDTDGDGSYPARCDNYKCGYYAIGWKVIDDTECVFHADKALTWKGPSSFHINWSSSCCTLANQCSWGQNKYICLKKVQKAYNRWVNGQ